MIVLFDFRNVVTIKLTSFHFDILSVWTIYFPKKKNVEPFGVNRNMTMKLFAFVSFFLLLWFTKDCNFSATKMHMLTPTKQPTVAIFKFVWLIPINRLLNLDSNKTFDFYFLREKNAHTFRFAKNPPDLLRCHGHRAHHYPHRRPIRWAITKVAWVDVIHHVNHHTRQAVDLHQVNLISLMDCRIHMGLFIHFALFCLRMCFRYEWM